MNRPPTAPAADTPRKPDPGYAESSTERDALGRGDDRPRDRGAYRVEGQDPGYGPRATDPDDAVSPDADKASESGSRRTSGDRAAGASDSTAPDKRKTTDAAAPNADHDKQSTDRGSRKG